MSRFTDATTSITPVGGKDWEVLDPIVWEIGEKGSGRELHIPIGFRCDLASIPRPFWWLLQPAGQPQVLAAICHDYLYRRPKRRPLGLRTKRSVDREFREMMKALGTPAPRRWVMWAAVRCAPWAGNDWGWGTLET